MDVSFRRYRRQINIIQRGSPSAGIMMGHRHRRWPNIIPALKSDNAVPANTIRSILL